MGFVTRLLKFLFYSHMGDCDYFEYNSRQFRITGRVLHFMFFPFKVEEALMRMPVSVFGSFGGIDISHVPGAKERCRKWAMSRAYLTWLALLIFALAAVCFAGVFGTIAFGIGLLFPGVLVSAVATYLYVQKPAAPEFAIDNYRELLKPLFPESDLPNLEPTALEAIEAILNGKELQNELGKAMEEQKVDSSQVMDSCLLVHPCIAAGNHGSNHESLQEPPEEPRGSGVGRRTLLEGKLEVSEPECSGEGEETREPSIDKQTVVQISPLAKMLEAIPEPAGEGEDDNGQIEMHEMPPGNNSQFCITADESSDRLSQDQWRGVATTLDKFLGPRASLFGRGILPPETNRSHERGNSAMFLEDTPVHDGSHIVYVETSPSPLQGPKSKSEKKKLRQGMKALERAVFKSQTAV